MDSRISTTSSVHLGVLEQWKITMGTMEMIMDNSFTNNGSLSFKPRHV